MKKKNMERKIKRFLAYLILTPIYTIGLLLWIVLKPILALSHLMMFSPHLAKRIITDWSIEIDL